MRRQVSFFPLPPDRGPAGDSELAGSPHPGPAGESGFDPPSPSGDDGGLAAAGTRVLSVRELTGRIKAILDNHPGLREVLVRGELSNFKDHPSGHLYFTLKDEAAALRCVMFRGRREAAFPAWSGATLPRNGEVVVAQGYVSVYERDGSYQLYVQHLWRDEQARLGALYLALEELKARLQAEGLFDPSRKRPLPLLPRRVGIVTSPSGAALRDMVRVIRRRFPNAHLVLIPALVQGDEAPADLARAVDLANACAACDVLIVGRGGGSIEDLWAFNSEAVARAIARSAIPVVSAVGHETDFTVADLVADLRAPTPSAAAELVVPEKRVLERRVADLALRLQAALRQQVARDRARLEKMCTRPALARPLTGIYQHRQRLDELAHRLGLAARRRLERARAIDERLRGRLEALDPLAVLGRGYSLCLDASGRPVSGVAGVRVGDRVRVVLRDGALGCAVETVDVASPACSLGRERHDGEIP